MLIDDRLAVVSRRYAYRQRHARSAGCISLWGSFFSARVRRTARVRPVRRTQAATNLRCSPISGIGLSQFKRGPAAGKARLRQRVCCLAIQYLANQGSQFIDPNRLAGDMANPVALLGFLVELIAVASDDDDRYAGAHLL